MCPVFFCADFWDGACLMRSAYLGAVCGFGRSGRQNSLEQSVFCLLCGPQALDLVAGVDKIRRKSLFLSTFGVAVGGFGCGSRQN